MEAVWQERYTEGNKAPRRPWEKTDTLNCPRVVKPKISVFSSVPPNFLFSPFFWIIAHNLLTQLWTLREWQKECLTRRVSPLTSLGRSRRSDGALMNGCAATIKTFVRGRNFTHKSAADCKGNLFLPSWTLRLRCTRRLNAVPNSLVRWQPKDWIFTHLVFLCVNGFFSNVHLGIWNKDHLVAQKPELGVKALESNSVKVEHTQRGQTCQTTKNSSSRQSSESFYMDPNHLECRTSKAFH